MPYLVRVFRGLQILRLPMKKDKMSSSVSRLTDIEATHGEAENVTFYHLLLDVKGPARRKYRQNVSTVVDYLKWRILPNQPGDHNKEDLKSMQFLMASFRKKNISTLLSRVENLRLSRRVSLKVVGAVVRAVAGVVQAVVVVEGVGVVCQEHNRCSCLHSNFERYALPYLFAPEMIPNEICQTILEAAILDFNIIQAQHQIELKIISKWWTEASVNKLNFFRHRHVEYYLAYPCGLYEHEFSLTRVGYAKLGTIITVIDDIFDTYGTYDELIHFKEAVINWDMSMMDRFPKFMQICLQFTHETYMELADEAEKIHGPRARKWMQEY
ncbi:hypothetical protein SUGI_0793260, partial [Cryptomeria japonica]